MQGTSCTLAVSSLAYAGVPPPYMDVNPMREAPSVTAARHATKFATNIEPVSCSLTALYAFLLLSVESAIQVCTCTASKPIDEE